MFLEKLETFAKNMKTLLISKDKVCAAVFLMKLQASTRNVSQRVCDWVVFSKVLGLY